MIRALDRSCSSGEAGPGDAFGGDLLALFSAAMTDRGLRPPDEEFGRRCCHDNPLVSAVPEGVVGEVAIGGVDVSVGFGKVGSGDKFSSSKAELPVRRFIECKMLVSISVTGDCFSETSFRGSKNDFGDCGVRGSDDFDRDRTCSIRAIDIIFLAVSVII